MQTYFVEPNSACSAEIAKFELQGTSLSRAGVTKVCSSKLEIKKIARDPTVPNVEARFQCSTEFHLTRQPKHSSVYTQMQQLY